MAAVTVGTAMARTVGMTGARGVSLADIVG